MSESDKTVGINVIRVTIKLMRAYGVFSQSVLIASGCEWNAHNLESSQHMDRGQP